MRLTKIMYLSLTFDLDIKAYSSDDEGEFLDLDSQCFLNIFNRTVPSINDNNLVEAWLYLNLQIFKKISL